MTDYFYYTTVYGGRLLEEDDFLRLKNRAQRYVSGLLHPRSQPGGWCEAARFAVCAAAEALFEEEKRQENGDIQSETVGRHTVSYAQERAAKRLYSATARWLEPAGLIYRGIL